MSESSEADCHNESKIGKCFCNVLLLTNSIFTNITLNEKFYCTHFISWLKTMTIMFPELFSWDIYVKIGTVPVKQGCLVSLIIKKRTTTEQRSIANMVYVTMVSCYTVVNYEDHSCSTENFLQLIPYCLEGFQWAGGVVNMLFAWRLQIFSDFHSPRT